MRSPAVAGLFYPNSKEELEQLLSMFDKEVPEQKFKAISGIAPHAGYVYSGRIATFTYKAIKNINPKTVVIVGPDHIGLAAANAEVAVYSSGAWKSPLGRLTVDEKLAEKIIDAVPSAYADETAHEQEHSIEVQIPFIQYFIGEVKIVPIMMGIQDMETAVELGKAIASVSDDKTVVIGSSDMSHYVPVEKARKQDLWALEALVNMNEEEFYQRIASGVTACGYGPSTAAMVFARERGAKSGRLLAYGTSSDITGDSKCVGYASVIFESPVV